MHWCDVDLWEYLCKLISVDSPETSLCVHLSSKYAPEVSPDVSKLKIFLGGLQRPPNPQLVVARFARDSLRSWWLASLRMRPFKFFLFLDVALAQKSLPTPGVDGSVGGGSGCGTSGGGFSDGNT